MFLLFVADATEGKKKTNYAKWLIRNSQTSSDMQHLKALARLGNLSYHLIYKRNSRCRVCVRERDLIKCYFYSSLPVTALHPESLMVRRRVRVPKAFVRASVVIPKHFSKLRCSKCGQRSDTGLVEL